MFYSYMLSALSAFGLLSAFCLLAAIKSLTAIKSNVTMCFNGNCAMLCDSNKKLSYLILQNT